MLRAILLIFAFLMTGELFKYGFSLSIPGNILGMGLIFLSLKIGWVKLEQVKPASDKLLRFLPLFFIPYGVGLMVCGDLLVKHWLPILTVIVFSTILTLYASGFIQQKLEKNDGENL